MQRERVVARRRGLLDDRAASTEASWTSSIGLGAGSIATSGAYLALFSFGGAPQPNVTLFAGGAVNPSSDFYFGDTDPGRRSVIDPARDTTGQNGAALFINGPLTQYTGAGAGCTFPAIIGGSTPGVIVVQEFPGNCQ